MGKEHWRIARNMWKVLTGIGRVCRNLETDMPGRREGEIERPEAPERKRLHQEMLIVYRPGVSDQQRAHTEHRIRPGIVTGNDGKPK